MLKINNTEAKKLIKTTIEKILNQFDIKVERIILFGSRARGDYKEDSDWDCFVIVNSDLEREKKRKIIAKIRKELACFGIPNDVIIQSSRVVEERKNDVGYLTYWECKEGLLMRSSMARNTINILLEGKYEKKQIT